MNLSDGYFLVLDLGTNAVRAYASQVLRGRIVNSELRVFESPDTVYALKQAIDGLESKMGRHFDSAFITGNFGPTKSDLIIRTTNWGAEHKITAADVYAAVRDAMPNSDSDVLPLHIIPMRYDVSGFPNLATPIGQVAESFTSAFCVISVDRDGLQNISQTLRHAHLESAGFYDPMFLLGNIVRPKKQPAVIIDLGAAWASVSVWTVRGPVYVFKIPFGLARITDAIAAELNITWEIAERIKRGNMSAIPSDMDRFTPADTAYDFSRADINDIAMPMLIETIDLIFENLIPYIEKYNPAMVYVSGGGSEIEGIDTLFKNKFGLSVKLLGSDAAATSAAAFVWKSQESRVKSYMARRKKWDAVFGFITKIFKRKKKIARPAFIPIMPSSLSFDMTNPDTYKMFNSAGISMIHCDIMDGFYVDNIAGSIDMIRTIRKNTNARIHLHLMTESPTIWAAQAIDAGADTIIISTGTAGVRAAIQNIKEAGLRAGIALHPNTSPDILKPILRDIDEILVMSVVPGAGGQEFIPDAVERIKILFNTRRKYNLKFKISVDGGINADTAKLCWDAGADFLISGNYLASAPDFPLAVQSLLKK